MKWLIFYLIISVIVSIILTKRMVIKEDETDMDEILIYFVACFVFWPIMIINLK